MCGRYALMSAAELVAELCGLSSLPPAIRRYNIAPTQRAPVVRQTDDGERRLDQLFWGLVPWWAKDPKIGTRMINARSETAAEKPAFREALQRRRCLVPADGFYEWRKREGGKQPHFIRRRDHGPLAFAGLWEGWRDGAGESMESFTILTTRPNDLVAPLHDRMPVILDRDDFAAWLDPETHDTGAIRSLLGPCPADTLETH
ncbi:MAG: SOS response-associated peptidase, partial [Phycisphaerae bacterium]|nr:SOS response-associated peptidase [Phycisphaerae bacterium]